MKRQALGKGLSSLIPGKGDLDSMRPTSPPPVPQNPATSGEKKPDADLAAKKDMSAADTFPAPGSTVPSTPQSARTPAERGPIETHKSTPRSTATPGKAAGSMGGGIVSAADIAKTGSAAGSLTMDLPAVSGPATGGSQSGMFQWIDIDRIQPNPNQPRRQFPDAEIAELAASIRSSGILQPVIVRRVKDGFGLVAGERRWRAAQRVGLHKVPALIREIAEERLLEVALIENLQRQDLNPIEEARAFGSLVQEHGLTQSEIAERVGRQRSTIANALRLLTLSPKVQSLVESGKISMGHARALVALPTPRAQEMGAEIFLKRGFSVREAEAWVGRHAADPEPSVPTPIAAPVDPNVRAAEQRLQSHLGTKVRIVAGRGERGRIEIAYYSAAELDRLFEKIVKSSS